MLKEPVVLSDAPFNMTASAGKTAWYVDKPVMAADVAARRVEQLSQHRRHPDAGPLGLRGGAYRGVEAVIVELALQHVRERRFGVFDIDVQAVEVEHHGLVAARSAVPYSVSRRDSSRNR